ncbi:MAG: hypothetical protein J7L39_00425, partial [Candidatus Aenigmarchaeota archaeon]|nr:hypothetical protein [Candidatus Aenigmarchaeota archaeon]
LAALLVLTGWRYFGPIFAMAFSFLVSFLLYFSKKILKKGKRIDGKKIFLTFAIPAFMANLAWLLFNNTQYIVLSLLKTTEVTGIFSVAFLICSQLAPIPGILTQAMFPLISQLSAKKDKLRQSLLISTAFKYTLIIGLPLISVFVLFRNFLILLISRTEYLGGGEYFLLLAPSALLFGLGRLFLVNIYALGESKVYRNISVLIAISYLILSIILTIPYSGFGLALSYFFTSLLFFTLSISFFHRKVKIRVEMNTILKIIFCCLLFSLISYLIDITSNGMITKVIAMLANFVVYGILILKFVFDERDVRILKIIARKVGGNKLVKLVERLS